MWFLMMIAMMLPSATPMIARCGLRGGRARGKRSMAPASIFAGAAYLAVGERLLGLAALAQWLLVRSGAVSEINLTSATSVSLS